AERNGNDVGILVIVPVQRIETEQAQVFGQFPEMDVENEFRLTQRLRSEAEEGSDVKAFEDRIDRHTVAVTQPIIKGDRHPVDQNEVDFSVGDTYRHYGLFDGWHAVERIDEGELSLRGREKIVKLRVESESGNLQGHG